MNHKKRTGLLSAKIGTDDSNYGKMDTFESSNLTDDYHPLCTDSYQLCFTKQDTETGKQASEYLTTESENMVDTHAIQLVLLFIGSPLDNNIEDTYVHNWIIPLLKPIFSCEPLRSIEWANRHITETHKPVLYCEY
jgi:hypothetical protein